MIFVTVGTQLPFDRLVQTVDRWAGQAGRCDVFAQIGPSTYKPQNIGWANFLDAETCRQKVEEADVVIAHAGMGSIITALELGKPILVMPRLSERREHRNDHQVSTAKQFLKQGRIEVAFDELSLAEKLTRLDKLQGAGAIERHARTQLLDAICGFIQLGKVPAHTGAAADERFVPAAGWRAATAAV